MPSTVLATENTTMNKTEVVLALMKFWERQVTKQLECNKILGTDVFTVKITPRKYKLLWENTKVEPKFEYWFLPENSLRYIVLIDYSCGLPHSPSYLAIIQGHVISAGQWAEMCHFGEEVFKRHCYSPALLSPALKVMGAMCWDESFTRWEQPAVVGHNKEDRYPGKSPTFMKLPASNVARLSRCDLEVHLLLQHGLLFLDRILTEIVIILVTSLRFSIGEMKIPSNGWVA